MEALLLLNLQNDFCRGGALEIEGAENLISLANQCMNEFGAVIATREWHPANHVSFAAMHPWRRPGQVIKVNNLEQTLFPMYCIQHSFGAEFHKNLETGKINAIFSLGTDAQFGTYSAFYDNGRHRSTGLHAYLTENHITGLHILGLGIDNFITNTLADAIELGYSISVIPNGCPGVNNGDTTHQSHPENEFKGPAFSVNGGTTK